MPPIHALVRACGLTLMGLMPLWVRPGLRHPILRAFIPVLATYATVSIGGAFLVELTRGEELAPPELEAHRVVGLWSHVAVLTVVHLLIPAVVYVGYSVTAPRRRDDSSWGCLLFMFTLGWFGVPILALASKTGPMSLIAAAIHLVFARRQERHWVFVEYGSTSFALLLFVLNFGGAHFYVALPIVLFQTLMLTLLAVWGRPLVLTEETSEARPQRTPVKVKDPNHAPIDMTRARRSNRRRRRSD